MFAKLLFVLHHVKRWRHAKNDKMELHQHLKQAREQSGKTVNEVAAALGVSRVQVWRMEKDADFVSVARLKLLADLYGKPITSFFDDTVPVGSGDISYQLIGMSVAAVEGIASKMSKRPSPDATRSAVLSVIRAQQARLANDPATRFKADEFTVLIEQELQKDRAD